MNKPKMPPKKKVFSIFCLNWVAIIRNAMLNGSKGYRIYSGKNTGRGEDRRKDKLADGKSKHFRSYQNRYRSVST